VPVVRLVDVPPDPLALARALAGRPGLAVLASRPQAAPRPEDARWSFVACDPVASSEDLVPDVAGQAPVGPAPLWIGVVPYEALRSLERPAWTRHPDDRPPCALPRPAWRRYPAVLRVDHRTGRVAIVADDDATAGALARALRRSRSSLAGPGAFQLRPLAPDEPDEAHRERVRAALRLIAAGDIFEVNLARRIRMFFQGDTLALFESLLARAPAPWGFLQDLGSATVCGTTPELALSVRGDTLRTCPIKGTRPRGRDSVEDAGLARALDADPKERAELTMAVDVHRNDLGRVAEAGSVRVLGEPRVLGGRTVWSRVAEVVARRAPGTTLEQIARAVLPCGSITGAPKVRAMEVIARLEPWRRGVYTGVVGYVGRDGGLELAMAIRTLEITSGSKPDLAATYFSGGGIVADSDPERELQETRWKARQLEGAENASLGAPFL
jgi:anthranilate/para-aminobenzoate synthase component I